MAKKKTRKIPLGKLPAMTDDNLDELAFISPADIVKAQQFGAKYAGRLGRDLLNAEKVDNE